jgi:hypothetical protein
MCDNRVAACCRTLLLFEYGIGPTPRAKLRNGRKFDYPCRLLGARSRPWSELRVALSAFFAACDGQREPVFQAKESDDHTQCCA